MPQAAASAVFFWVGSTFGSLSTAAVAAIAYTTYAVTTLALSVGLSKLSQSLAGKPQDQYGSQTRDVVVKNTVEPRQMIYGETRTAGTLVFYGCSGTENRFLWFVIAVAGHQCEDISDCWVGPTLVPDADIDPSTGQVSTADFIDGGGVSRLVIRRHLGAGNQAADAALVSDFPSEWSSDHKGLGVSYVAYRLDRSDEVWSTGAPSAFYHLVKGRRLYDPRKDSTDGGSGSHRVNDATTWEWSNNAALALRDYITGGAIVYTTATPDKRLGVGESDVRADAAYWIAAANICDEDVLIPPASPPTTQKRYTCDTQISCGSPHMQNLEIFNSAMIGHLSYVEGKYRGYAGAYDTPTVDLVEDDIVGPVEITTHPQGEDNYNLVTGTFYDELKGWQLTPFPARTNSTYESADGGQRPRAIELIATRTSYRAQRIAEVHLKQSRNKQIVKFTALSPKAMNISEWETFTVTISEYGWSAQVMRCLEWEFLPSGFISITARIEGAAAYADPAVGDYTTAETSSIPAPQLEAPDSPTALSTASFPQGIVISIGPPSFYPAGALLEIWEHASSTPFSSAVKVAETRSSVFFLSKRDAVTRYYWVTTILGNRSRSDPYPSGSGVAGVADKIGTTDTDEGAFTIVESQFEPGPVSMSGTGPFFPGEIFAFDCTPQNVDCKLVVTISYNQSLGNISGTQRCRAYFYNGTTNTLSADMPIVINDGANPSRSVLQGVFDYTANDDARVGLFWSVTPVGSPAPNSADFTDIMVKAEFIKR